MSIHDDPEVVAAQEALDEWEAQEADLLRALGKALRAAQERRRVVRAEVSA